MEMNGVRHTCVSVNHMNARCQLRPEGSTGLPGTRQMVVNHYVVLGSESGSLARAAYALNY